MGACSSGQEESHQARLSQDLERVACEQAPPPVHLLLQLESGGTRPASVQLSEPVDVLQRGLARDLIVAASLELVEPIADLLAVELEFGFSDQALDRRTRWTETGVCDGATVQVADARFLALYEQRCRARPRLLPDSTIRAVQIDDDPSVFGLPAGADFDEGRPSEGAVPAAPSPSMDVQMPQVYEYAEQQLTIPGQACVKSPVFLLDKWGGQESEVAADDIWGRRLETPDGCNAHQLFEASLDPETLDTSIALTLKLQQMWREAGRASAGGDLHISLPSGCFVCSLKTWSLCGANWDTYRMAAKGYAELDGTQTTGLMKGDEYSLRLTKESSMSHGRCAFDNRQMESETSKCQVEGPGVLRLKYKAEWGGDYYTEPHIDLTIQCNKKLQHDWDDSSRWIVVDVS